MAEQIALSWGGCDVYVKKLTDTTYKKLATPVDGSTTLTPTTQDAMEAPVEGGELEARKAKANKYELVFQIRIGGDRDAYIPHINGIVDDEYSVAIVPRDLSAKGIIIDRASVNILDSKFDSANGIVDEFHFTGLKPEIGNIVKRGVLTVGGTTDAYTVALAGSE